MRKQVIAWFLIATLSALTIPLMAQAHQHDIDGQDLSYHQSQSGLFDPSYPWYCECHHEVWSGDPSDTMAGLSLTASYISHQDSRFNWAHWEFYKEWGDNMESFNGLTIDACVNGYDHHHYTTYNSPVWGVPNSFANFECWYVRFDAGQVTMNPCNSVEGSSMGGFWDPNDPNWPWDGHYWYVEAYTQNPSYYPDGNGWSFLTAWHGDD